MNSNISVKELRCSLVWVYIFGKGGKFGNPTDYYNEFMNAARHTGEWGVPWINQPPAVFWEKYLEEASLVSKQHQNNNGANACMLRPKKVIGCIVPLRKKQLGRLELDRSQATDEVLTPWIEGFSYPHGVAFVVTLRWRSKDGLKLKDMVDRLINLRVGRQWSSQNAILCDGQKKTLNEISQNALKYLANSHGLVLQEVAQFDPYTVVTLVEAKNFTLDDTHKLVADGDIHRAFDALCTFDNGWLNNPMKLLDLRIAMLATKGNRRYDVLYARGRGRVVCLPGFFRENSQPLKRKAIQYLGNYHRNLTFATMQAAYLSTFLKWVSQQHNGLTGDEQDWAKAAAGSIARLYGKCTKSYMSSSLPRIIDYFSQPVNEVRKKYIPEGRQI